MGGGVVTGEVGVPTAYSLNHRRADRKRVRLVLIFLAGVGGIKSARGIARVPAKAQAPQRERRDGGRGGFVIRILGQHAANVLMVDARIVRNI